MNIYKKLSSHFRFNSTRKSFPFNYSFYCLLILLQIFFIISIFHSQNIKSVSVNPDSQFSENEENKTEKPLVGMANPAAVYCEEMGYEYQNVTESDGSQHGICIFPDNSSCGDWDFYKGKCGEQYSYCTRNGYKLTTVADGNDPYSYEYSVCVSRNDGRSLGSVAKLMDLVDKASKGKSSFQEREIKDTDNENQLPEKIVSGFQANPSSFDWRSYNGGNYTTPVKNQGSCGSCWSYSAVGVVESIYDIASGNSNYNLNLSEQYHVAGCDSPSFCSACCGGWNDVALELIRDNGIPDESCLPYVDVSSCTCGDDTCDTNCTYRTGDYCSDATCSDRCSNWSDRLTKVRSVGVTSSYGNPANLTTMKADLIAHGPLSVAFDSTNGDWYYDDTMENIVYGCVFPVYSNHAVVIVGYDDNHGDDGYWIVKNSWGDDWGWESDGYFKIFYGSCLIEESGVYYADPTEYKYYIQNSSETNVASLSSLGNIVLDGTCTAGGTCPAPDNSFIVQNSTGGTVGYISSTGNMCIETGTCSDQSANCDSPSGDAFIIQNPAGENMIYIDEIGDLCLIGTLTESGNP